MTLKITSQIEKRKRIRWLASNDRAGRYSRDYAWQQIEKYLANKKAIYVAMALTPLVLISLTTFFLHGALRWLVLGIVGTSGVWFALLQVILRSGAASNVMGTDGEVSTAEVLRTFRRRGWRVINDLKIHPKYGIDHVAIGPTGILIIETKWARDPWPMDGDNDADAWASPGKAIWQANRGREEFQNHFKNILGDTPIEALSVFWSAHYPSKRRSYVAPNGVEVLIGPELSNWIKRQDNKALNDAEVDKIWSEIDKFVMKRDAEDSESKTVYKPTLMSLLFDSALAPIAEIAGGVSASLLGLMSVGNVTPSQLLPSAIAFVVIGLLIRVRKTMRLFSLGWLGTSLTYCIAFAAIWIQHALTR